MALRIVSDVAPWDELQAPHSVVPSVRQKHCTKKEPESSQPMLCLGYTSMASEQKKQSDSDSHGTKEGGYFGFPFILKMEPLFASKEETSQDTDQNT